ncbi:MAG: hypothetical protein ACTSRS_02940 [Candidatus Helarchaeota archaeon]
MSPKEKNKKDILYVTIFIHDPKQITEIRSNTLSKSSNIVRVRGLHKKEKNWLTLAYRIPLDNLGLEEKASKKEILDRLLNPSTLLNKDTKILLSKLQDQYGVIKPRGREKFEYKTERFKKKWKMKVRRVGGI